MSTVSPPKPWERRASATTQPSPFPNHTTNATSTAPTTRNGAAGIGAGKADAPPLPERPSILNSVVNQTASNYADYGNTPYTSSGVYGGGGGGGYASGYGGGYSSYNTPYSRFGGMGSMGGMYGSGMYGGGYGGYGAGMYSGYGAGMGGGMYGSRMGPMQGNPNDPHSLTGSFNQSTQATFQIIESIVGAFGGFAQMLESTYMATHSSFFAMVSVAEQFGNLRDTLGSVLGVFTLLRWLRTLFAKITGRPPPADAASLNASSFASFLSRTDGKAGPTVLPDGTTAPPRPSRKPFIMFLVAVFGLPYLMGKLIRALAASNNNNTSNTSGPLARYDPSQQQQYHNQQTPIDPSKLDFCRVLYDYSPPSSQSSSSSSSSAAPAASFQTSNIDLTVKKGDFVAVLSRLDPIGNPSEWWRCRTRDGRIGYLPSPYLEVIQRRNLPQLPSETGENGGRNGIGQESAPDSRTGTLRTLGESEGEGEHEAGRGGGGNSENRKQ